MSAKGQKRTFNENPVSKCSAILASFSAILASSRNDGSRPRTLQKGHRLCAVALLLNCRSRGWNSGSSPIKCEAVLILAA
jgi:hypothetical protein